jgi:hypothetical protein
MDTFRRIVELCYFMFMFALRFFCFSILRGLGKLDLISRIQRRSRTLCTCSVMKVITCAPMLHDSSWVFMIQPTYMCKLDRGIEAAYFVECVRCHRRNPGPLTTQVRHGVCEHSHSIYTRSYSVCWEYSFLSAATAVLDWAGLVVRTQLMDHLHISLIM